jgi:hypothetical protein
MHDGAAADPRAALFILTAHSSGTAA